MKRKGQLFNVLLATIFILSVASCNKLNHSTASQDSQSGSNGTSNGKIAYVEIDTVIKYYNLTNEVKASMEISQKQREADFTNKSRAFQMDVAEFKNKVQKGLVSQTSAQDMQQQLGQREQDLYKLQDQYRAEQTEDAQVNQRKLLQGIMDYLKIYNKDKHYQYILANTFPSTLLFADSALNISKEVIKGLNEKYKKEVKK